MHKLVAGMIAFYISAFLYLELPFVKMLSISGATSSGLFLNHLAIFLIIFFVSSFLISKHVVIYGTHLKLIVGSLILLGLFITLFYHLIPIAPLYTIPSILNPFFESSIAYTVWLILPLVFLFF